MDKKRLLDDEKETRLRWQLYLERNSNNPQNAKRETQNALKPRLCDSELQSS